MSRPAVATLPPRPLPVDRAAVHVQGRGAGDHDEEADHARHHRAGDHVHALEREIARAQPLVDGVRLDERQPPGCERRAHGGSRDEQRVPLKRQRGNDKAAGGRAPARMGEHSRGEVGDEHRGKQEQHMLDALEPAAHDQRRDQDCREGHARVAADAGELRGAAMPANSAQVVPTLATSRTTAAEAAARWP
jgi:hypothetical protein